MFQHFGQRLKRDLKQLVDRRLDASMAASGSQLRVRFRIYTSPLHSTHALFSHLVSTLKSSLTNANGAFSE